MQDYCPWCMTPVKPGERCSYCGKDPALYSPESHHLPPGTMLNRRFVLGGTLGEGGFGITYIGWDTKTKKRVAIKEYFPSSFVKRESSLTSRVTCYTKPKEKFYEYGKDNFFNEALAMAKLDDVPEIVQVYATFLENNTAYIAMEFLEGRTLKQLLSGDETPPMSAQETLTMIQPILRGMIIMHKKGLIHRDISPDNIMRLTDGSVKLLDFGCARDMEEDGTLTVVLKHGFAPIEQYTGHDQGSWTDVYAICATMYYCMTKKTPPRSLIRDAEVRRKPDPLIPPTALGADLTPQQEAALLKGLAIQQQDRWQTIDELYHALYEPEPEPVFVEPEPEPVFVEPEPEPSAPEPEREPDELEWLSMGFNDEPQEVSPTSRKAAAPIEDYTVPAKQPLRVGTQSRTNTSTGTQSRTNTSAGTQSRTQSRAGTGTQTRANKRTNTETQSKAGTGARLKTGTRTPTKAESMDRKAAAIDAQNSMAKGILSKIFRVFKIAVLVFAALIVILVVIGLLHKDSDDNDGSSSSGTGSAVVLDFSSSGLTSAGLEEKLSGISEVTELYLSGNQIDDLSVLSELEGLEILYLYDNSVSDLSPLSGLTSLRELELGGNQISDLSSLSELNQLEVLYLYDNSIDNLDPLNGLTNLKQLYLYDNQISNVLPLNSLTNLEVLYLYNNQIADLSPLSQLTSLRELELTGNAVTDLSPLSGLNALEDLRLSNNSISDLSSLANSNLTNLKRLYLQENAIEDLTALGSLTSLEELYLPKNAITNLEPLSSLTNLSILYLWDNRFTDLSSLAGLTGLTVLDISYNDVSDLSALSGLTNLQTLTLYGTSASAEQLETLQGALSGTEIKADSAA